MNPVVHFQMPYDNKTRMKKFYESVFGWKIQMLGEEMGNYVLATTTESDENGPKQPGAINGGFYQKPDQTGHYPSIVIAVDDVRLSIDQIINAGGQTVGEPMEIPGVGIYAPFLDTEGNQAGLLQPTVRNPGSTKSK